MPRLRTRSIRTAANFGIVPLATLSVPPCQVTLIVVPVLCASCAVRMNDCIRSGSVKAVLLKKIRENWGCSSRIFCSMSFALSSVTPAARLMAA